MQTFVTRYFVVMRNLMRKTTLFYAVPTGVLIAITCLPYLYSKTDDAQLLQLRIAFLFPLAILVAQVAVAWRASDSGTDVYYTAALKKSWPLLLALGIGMSVFSFIVVDPLLKTIRPDFFPQSLSAWAESLPWKALLQPLLLIIAPYAFALRLTRREWAGFVLALLVQQCILFSQLWSSNPVTAAMLVLLSGGVYTLIKTWCYTRWGLAGPVVLVICIQLRHLVRLLG